MKRLAALLLSVMILSSCAPAHPTATRVANPARAVADALEGYQLQNGVVLVEKGDKTLYLFLNGSVVLQGGLTTVFSDITAEMKEGTLFIRYQSREVAPENGQTIDNKVLYQITLPRAPETIEIFNNDQAVSAEIILL